MKSNLLKTLAIIAISILAAIALDSCKTAEITFVGLVKIKKHSRTQPLPIVNADFTTSGKMITGRVVNKANDSAIASARIVLYGPGAYLDTLYTDFDGTFQSEGLDPGTYEIQMEALGFLTLNKYILVKDKMKARSIEISSTPLASTDGNISDTLSYTN